jgi:hypothetical protein
LGSFHEVVCLKFDLYDIGLSVLAVILAHVKKGRFKSFELHAVVSGYKLTSKL